MEGVAKNYNCPVVGRKVEVRKAVHWAVVAVPKVSWEAYTM